MGLNQTPSANRIHIGIFGRRNAGKSSVINAITGQKLAIVSDIKGTTTDPVHKSMELLPLGPVVLIDTPGLDDDGALGEMRIEKAMRVLDKVDIALLILDATQEKSPTDTKLINVCIEKEIPYLLVWNKCDLLSEYENLEDNEIYVSAKDQLYIEELKEKIASIMPVRDSKHRIIADMISPMDVVILVVPIDSGAPKGRLILPQQQTIRELLEAGAITVVIQEPQLRETLKTLERKPRMIITDSQIFAKVAAETPSDISLTSFSILFARYKGFLDASVYGAEALDTLDDDDPVLICEGCTHHRQCNDIGTVKLPAWIRRHAGSEPKFEFVAGNEFPDDLSRYKLIVHCGGCMLGEREMSHRQRSALQQQVPISNYGVSIAHMEGILKRCTTMFSSPDKSESGSPT